MLKKNSTKVVITSDLGKATLSLAAKDKKEASTQAKALNKFFKQLDIHDLMKARAL